MNLDDLNLELKENSKVLVKDFNKSKFVSSIGVASSPFLKEIQAYSKKQCLNKHNWALVEKVDAWMLSAETATFMKIGGLGVIASELPESFNRVYGKNDEKMSIITPLYSGSTLKKETSFSKNIYTGSEHKDITLEKVLSFDVAFLGKIRKYINNKIDVYKGFFAGVEYIFLANDRFFSINPHQDNKSAQDGCYVYNENGIDEVERFAFFSKAIHELLKIVCKEDFSGISKPNILVANDWHLGAVAGLNKYMSTALIHKSNSQAKVCNIIREIPIIHIAHHLGYQGWDYHNTSRILNSLYEDFTYSIFKNAKAIKNSNPRVENTLIVHDCYNQASASIHLADRVVTVSKNYAQEVSQELKFGYDFRDILKIRKDHRCFFGIVNGYDKKLISPNCEIINKINDYFSTKFEVFDGNNIFVKEKNQGEFIKLLSKLARDKTYSKKVLPKLDLYNFEDIYDLEESLDDIPIFCATSRLVEQKGYDIVVESILKLYKKDSEFKDKKMPILILGGAGDIAHFKTLKKLKDDITKFSKDAGRRVFVFHGYKDEFAYVIQLASDFYMMPSKFEPCGLTQMEAMAKGTLPIVTSTGGLVDTIINDIDGFRTEVFFVDNKKVYGTNAVAKRLKNNINAYAQTIEKALRVFYLDKTKLKTMIKNAMEKDFSWDVPNGSLQKYYKLFHTGHI